MMKIKSQNRKIQKAANAIVVAAGVFAAVSCATSPTGRKQLIVVPDSQMNQLGAQAFDQMKSQQPTVNDPAIVNYVKCVANPVAEQAKGKTPVDKWDVVVFKDDTPNAFALPGGKIGVHTGILKVAKTPDQLAAVLGHEVGHVIARHGSERMSQGLATQVAQMGASILTSGSQYQAPVMAALGVGAQYGVLLPFSRTQESEADQIGLNLSASAGFDPRQAIDLWKNMSAASGGQTPPEWLSTHPANQTRIDNLQALMPEALKVYQQAQAAGRKPNCGNPPAGY